MPLALAETPVFNPIDCLEDILSTGDWALERLDEDALVGEITAGAQRYAVQFLWRPDCDTLVFACNYGFRIAERQRPGLFRLLVRINDGMMTGCFNYSAQENLLSYRNSLIVHQDADATAAHLQDLIDIGLNECERYALAFDLLLNRQQTAEQAYQAAMFETVGEA